MEFIPPALFSSAICRTVNKYIVESSLYTYVTNNQKMEYNMEILKVNHGLLKFTCKGIIYADIWKQKELYGIPKTILTCYLEPGQTMR